MTWNFPERAQFRRRIVHTACYWLVLVKALGGEHIMVNVSWLEYIFEGKITW